MLKCAVAAGDAFERRVWLNKRTYGIFHFPPLTAIVGLEKGDYMRHFILLFYVSLILLASGCSDPLLGKWSVTDIDGTVEAIDRVPSRRDSDVTLEAFRTQFKEYYSGKHIEFTDDEPHFFLVPVTFDGSLRGCLRGAWTRDPENKDVVNVYRWVSGSMYNLWGRGTLDSDKMQIVIVTYGNPNPVLRLRKVR